MKFFLVNILFALAWVFLWDAFDLWALCAGFVLGYLTLGLYSYSLGTSSYGIKVVTLIAFAAYFIRILIKANLQIAWEVITPSFGQRPRTLRYDVSGLTPAEVTTLSNAITLTPGTLVIDISRDHCTLYIHSMYAEDREAAIREIDELRHRLMSEVFS